MPTWHPAVLLWSVHFGPAAGLQHKGGFHVHGDNAVIRVAASEPVVAWCLLMGSPWSDPAGKPADLALHFQAPIRAQDETELRGFLQRPIRQQPGRLETLHALLAARSASLLQSPSGRNTNGLAKPRFSTHQASLPAVAQISTALRQISAVHTGSIMPSCQPAINKNTRSNKERNEASANKCRTSGDDHFQIAGARDHHLRQCNSGKAWPHSYYQHDPPGLTGLFTLGSRSG